VGKPEVSGDLCAIIRAAEHPYSGRRLSLGKGSNFAERMSFWQGLTCDPGDQVTHLIRKLDCPHGAKWIERLRSEAIGAWRSADAEVDTPRRKRFENAELLGHLERGIVRQHHAGAADADRLRPSSDGCNQNFGRGADDGFEAMVLRNPEAVIAE